VTEHLTAYGHDSYTKTCVHSGWVLNMVNTEESYMS